MTESSADFQPSTDVVRIMSAHGEARMLRLRGVLAGRAGEHRRAAPGHLVLQHVGTGEELRVPLAPEGAGAGVVATIEVSHLVDGAATGEWNVVAACRHPSGAAPGCAVVSALDPARTPSVVVDRDDGLRRVRPQTSRRGQLTVCVERLPPHAEVQRVVVEEDAIVVDAVLLRVPEPEPAASALLVASLRGGGDRDEVVAPAALSGSSARARLPLEALATGAPGRELWDLYLRIPGHGTFRLAGLLDGVADKKRAVHHPPKVVESPSGIRSVRPYYTASNGLSVSSKPAQRSTPQSGAHAGSSAEEPAVRDRAGTRLLRGAALALARFVVRRVPTRRPIPAVRRGRPRISILVLDGYGMGGTVRTVLNQAAYLAQRHEVEVVSQLRESERPFFPLPAGVALTALDDRTDGGRPGWPLRLVAHRLAGMPSLLVHPVDPSAGRCTLWTDVQLVRRLHRQRGGILMATRPSLTLLMAQLAAPGVVTVGQEHMNFPQHRPALAEELHREYARLDALTVLTSGDLQDYSRVLAAAGTHVVRVPNAISPLTGGPADPGSKAVVAAGRLTRQKGFERLIAAFEQVVRRHPDWTLRIYGSGPQHERLQRMIADRGLYNTVLLMGRAARIGDELAKASVYVLSSRFEGFPMVLLEAMSKGLAVVAFDCPRGPSDIIAHGEDGLLVPEGDVDALARGILEVVEDEQRRRQLGAAARVTAARYHPDVVGRQWDELFAHLLAVRAPSWWHEPAPS